MDHLSLSDTEQRVQVYQSRIRVDYAAKIREVAKLTDEVAMWQIRLLEIEHENNILRQRLVLAKNEIVELEKGTTAVTASEKDKPSRAVATSMSKFSKLSLKRERSPSSEIADIPKRSSKKFKGRERAERSLSVRSDHSITDSSGESDDEPDIEHVSSPPESATDKYLQSMEALAIHPSPFNLEVDRSFLQVSYGGGIDRHFLTYIPAERNPSGKFRRRVVFPTLGINPSMPSRPGAPGLIFASRHHMLPRVFCTLFCKNSKHGSKWRYLGEYDGEWVGSMSAEIFRLQSPKFQQLWALQILKKREFDGYLVMRARIALRLASVIPMSDKNEELRTIGEEVNLIKNDRGRFLSIDDIIAAFADGDEKIDIIRVVCVQYDHVFADDMKTRFLKLVQQSQVAFMSSTTTPSSTTGVSEEKDHILALVQKCKKATAN
ncbi:hypothetical protein BJ912DRAFT_908633 [Pholiota molesta]|nr:hypothetical protein BJ912DRAFT_908633 [Pholiota molesta]